MIKLYPKDKSKKTKAQFNENKTKWMFNPYFCIILALFWEIQWDDVLDWWSLISDLFLCMFPKIL